MASNIKGVGRLKIFEIRLLRKIFGSKMDEVRADWRKLQNEELHYFHSSLNTIKMVKLRRMRCAGM
jgi:hypothetical protein